MNRIKQLDNPLLQAHFLNYLINNKKISKVNKEQYQEMFDDIIDNLGEIYNLTKYSVDVKKFFNPEDETNNIVPNFINTSDFINYSTTIYHTIKNKHIVEKILKAYMLEENPINIKGIKAVFNGKVGREEFITETGEKVIIETDELKTMGLTKKSFKETFKIQLPNTYEAQSLDVYPIVFTHIKLNGPILEFNIFSEEDIKTIPHFVIPKIKISQFLNR